MGFNVNSLNDYVNEQKNGLIAKTVLGAPSIKRFNVQSGVKYKDALNILDVTIAPADGSACGFDAQGADTFSQRILEVKPIKIQKEWCDKDLLKKWANYEVNVRATAEKLPFEQYLTDEVVKASNKYCEKTVWQGDSSLGINGILDILASEEGTVDVTFTGGQSAYDKIMSVYAAMPVDILDKAEIYVGQDMFRDFVQDMVSKNFYHYTAGEGLQSEFVLPATNTKVIAAEGLNGTGKVVAANPEYIYVGVDMEGDNEVFDLWFSKDARTWRLDIEFVEGVQIAYPDMFVLGA